ncbi:MAG TPA: HAD family hydrolase [Clostridiales bacterium]|nr:HAD family hydrolase [Clostridiales bacterium]HQP70139.1 HAD family hydrolase [Clostridiales bacterium]
MHKAVFLDRDGTVNVDKNYLIRIEDFEFEAGVPAALKYLYDKGYKLIIISNQSGIARGYFSVNDVEKLHERIRNEAEKRGFSFAGIYYCPHYAEGSVPEYSIDCECRKPGTALIEKAMVEHDIDRNESYMIGDKKADITAGKNAGLTTILVGTGYGKQTAETFREYDFYIEYLSEIKKII